MNEVQERDMPGFEESLKIVKESGRDHITPFLASCYALRAYEKDPLSFGVELAEFFEQQPPDVLWPLVDAMEDYAIKVQNSDLLQEIESLMYVDDLKSWQFRNILSLLWISPLKGPELVKQMQMPSFILSRKRDSFVRDRMEFEETGFVRGGR